MKKKKQIDLQKTNIVIFGLTNRILHIEGSNMYMISYKNAWIPTRNISNLSTSTKSMIESISNFSPIELHCCVDIVTRSSEAPEAETSNC